MSETETSEIDGTVLLCDSIAERRATLARTLRSAGFVIDEVDNSAAGIASIEQAAPTLVVLVLAGANSDPLSFCEMISKRRQWDTPPVLMVFEKEDQHLCELAHHANAADMISLPCSDSWFAARVRHHFVMATNRREMRRTGIAHAHAERLAHIGSWEWNTETNEMHWSDETYRVLGFPVDETLATQTNFWARVHPEDRQKVQAEAGDALDVAESYTLQHRLLLPDGTVRHVQQHGERLMGDGRSERWLAGSIQDITQQRLNQERIRYLANYDSLTGLANRRVFAEKLDQALTEARLEGRRVGLLYMDLDKFKRVNDTLGHSAGDQLLRHVANLLRSHTRGEDLVGRPGRTRRSADVSRLGGDEFMILLSDISEVADAGEVASRILDALPETIDIDGHQISCAGSIGISVFPEDAQDPETLIRHADTAMYHAKECDRNSYKFFSHRMNEAAQRRMLVESRLRIALDNREVAVHYQPKLDLRDDKICGMEALARWTDPELGGISPNEFIALAEETGQILKLGNQVLTDACCYTQSLLRDQGIRLLVSVNVSSQQFAREEFCQEVGEVLRYSGLDPTQLELEITESLMLQDDEATAVMMRDIKAMGVSISLDDFGTGYSSLSYLTRFPLDTLKLDRCFVRDVTNDPAAAGVASSVIYLGHSLGLSVVAEGVDMDEQREVFSAWGCDQLQGFLLSPAMPEDEFRRFVLEYNAMSGDESDKPDERI